MKSFLPVHRNHCRVDSFSNISHRGSSMYPGVPTTVSAQDTTHLPPESNLEYMPAGSTTVKRRTIADGILINSDLSSERLNPAIAMAHSNSAHSLRNSNSNLTTMSRPQTLDNLDGFSSTKSGGAVFDFAYDPSSESNDIVSDDLQERKSQSLLSSTDDRTSLSSSTKPRKSLMSTKLFKSFSNIRFRKKHTTT